MNDFLVTYMPAVVQYWDYIVKAIWETIYMVSVSLLFSALIGIPLGVLLVITSRNHLLPMPALNQILGFVINILRSIPYIVLVIILIPFSRKLIGTSIGPEAAIISLVAGSAPFVARLVETAIREVNRGVIEAAQSMGASNWQIIRKILIPEALPAIVSGITVTAVGLIGYSAMAGVVGAGGLGAMAYTHGFNGFKEDILFVTTLLLILLVQGVQMIGDAISRKLDHR
ncbi:ABC transporter permease [Brevibacillus sp. SYP-B805]|jgi:D-methionine transport system permease protein|uniref:methionine ABC transporter permease n=1 Tax=Brevibacillus sp. SYP-B805 TaxID=1578199 RepID=UPI0013ED29BF|nr:methionine ABC transporter permease [Brevibacillus sp. SYP-B805]NGQ96003.1 ABC transporter permease [Brevibacillus sp. SYP-B805]